MKIVARKNLLCRLKSYLLKNFYFLIILLGNLNKFCNHDYINCISSEFNGTFLSVVFFSWRGRGLDHVLFKSTSIFCFILVRLFAVILLWCILEQKLGACL